MVIANLVISQVTPFVGVWIETEQHVYQQTYVASHPSWVCGLKHTPLTQKKEHQQVTPFVGVWIETTLATSTALSKLVTPFVGVWIET